jgi:S-adenosylmethionine hydrolase
MSSSVITLLTDFGQRDGFVGTMKGVILSICPEAKIVDISHEIEPQNIDAAAFVLNNSYKYFPCGTIHVVVIDPGVGSKRQIVCVSAFEHLFLAPDNGVLKYIYREYPEAEMVQVSNKKYFLHRISQTFHGRDIFAPVAAYLAQGVDFKDLGPPVEDCEKGRLPELTESPQGIQGEVVYIDHFGNLITNIPRERLEKYDIKSIEIHLKQWTIKGLCNSYMEGNKDAPIALIGSSGFLEISVKLGNAKAFLKCAEGDKIRVSF